MSEQISAFAAYNSKAPKVAASKKPGAQKPGAAKKTIASSAAAKKSANKSKSKSKTTTAKAASKPKAEPKTKTAPKAAQKPKAAPKVAPKSKAAPKATQNNKQTATPDIDLNEIDGLVDQLLLSPTSNKKLTKEQQKKKQDLEKYLIRQLEKDDEMGEEEGGSDEFSDEYTLDDSDSCSEEESETGSEGESGSDEESGSYDESCSDDESGSFEDDDDEGVKVANQPKSRKSLPAEKTQKTTVTASKRKSMDAPTAAEKEKRKSRMSAPIVANGDIAAKKAKKSNDEPYEVNGEVCKRRSKGGDAQPPAQSTPQAVHKSKVGNVKLEPLSPPSNVVKMNSITEGLKVFRWLLNPVSVEIFYAKYWERSACLVKRQQANYFSHLISFEAIDQMLLKNHVEFTKNIDVTSYKNGVRETLNPDGRAMPPVVWEHYGNGCSIRLLNPQTFLPALYTLNATLQEYFHCLVGANAYLTPPNSQGFAPHYDDIEAFVLQVEGRKRWKLYKPRSKSEELPRFSSPNFKQSEIGKPILDEVLQPGDILYFPRGTIHQACTEPGYHSLHITLSVYQKQSFADLFERMIPMMLQRAIASNVDLRRGLPLNTWHHAGIAFSDNDTKERQQLVQKVSQLLTKCMRDVPITELLDSAVDQLAKKFQHEALPPEVLPSERQRTVFGSKSKTNERGECVCDYDIELRTNVRLLRANILRLVEEEQKIRIYYYLDNSKEYCEYDPNFIEIEAEEAGSVEVLIKSYPEYVGVSQLPLADDERKIAVVTALWERGLLMMEKPFQ